MNCYYYFASFASARIVEWNLGRMREHLMCCSTFFEWKYFIFFTICLFFIFNETLKWIIFRKMKWSLLAVLGIVLLASCAYAKVTMRWDLVFEKISKGRFHVILGWCGIRNPWRYRVRGIGRFGRFGSWWSFTPWNWGKTNGKTKKFFELVQIISSISLTGCWFGQREWSCRWYRFWIVEQSKQCPSWR